MGVASLFSMAMVNLHCGYWLEAWRTEKNIFICIPGLSGAATFLLFSRLLWNDKSTSQKRNEKNVEKMCEMVKEISYKTEIIYLTHFVAGVL